MAADRSVPGDATRRFLERLQGLHSERKGWRTLCPAHEDKNPSLSIHVRDGKILLHCHAVCSPEAISAALGIELRAARILISGRDGYGYQMVPGQGRKHPESKS